MTHTYTVSDNRFEVVGNQLKLKDGISLDYETENTVALTITSTDAAGANKAQPLTLNVTDVNDAPVLTNVDNLNYTANGELSVFDNDLSLTDVDSPNLQSAKVQITSNFNSSEDVLSFTDQNGITGSWDASTGTLTLTGAASVADYEAALESVSYQNTATSRDTSVRSVSFTVNDGVENSTAVNATITVSEYNAPAEIRDEHRALSMNGSSDHLIANPVSNFPSNAFTFESWFKTSGSGDGLISYATASEDNEVLLLNQENLTLQIGGNSVATGINIADGDWHHVAWTWDSASGATKVFIDGVEKFSGTLAQGHSIENGGSLVIGQEQDGVGDGFDPAQAYAGEVRDIRLWDTNRTQADIDSQKNEVLDGSESNLVSNFTIKEGTSVVSDSGPGNNDLQKVGGTVEQISLATVEGEPVSIHNIQFADAESGSDAVTVTLSVPNGALTLAKTDGISITEGANNSTTMTLQGTIADINNAVAGLQFEPASGFNGNVDLTASISDSGSGGDSQATSVTRTITVTEKLPETPEITSVSLNDSNQPVIIGTGEPNSTLNFTINGIDYTTTVGNDGNFSYTPALTINNGDPLNLSLTASDADGTKSKATNYNTTFQSAPDDGSPVTGSGGDDYIKGDAGSNQISAGDGNDVITATSTRVGGRYGELLSNKDLSDFTNVTDKGSYKEVTLKGWQTVNTAGITNTDTNVDATKLPQINAKALEASTLQTVTDTSQKVTIDAFKKVDGIVQSFNTVNNALYTVSLDVAPRTLNSSDFEIWWGGKHVKTVSFDQSGWQNIEVLVSGNGSEQSIMLREVSGQNNQVGVVINSVSVKGQLPDGSGESGELLTNGNFASDASSWRAVDTGTITNSDYSAGIDVSTLPDGDLEIHPYNTDWLESSVDTSTKVELDSNNSNVDAIFQQVNTVDGQKYTLSFDAYSRVVDSGDVEIWWGGNYIKTVAIGTDWNTHTVNLTGDGTQQTLMIREVPSQSDGTGTLLNNISLQGVLPDTLDGGSGDDQITATAGSDIISGGADNDVITTGAGQDRLVWAPGDEGTADAPASDRVTDFTLGSGGDVLDLQGFLDGEENSSLDQYLSFRKDGNDTVISVSRSANGDVVQNIILEGVDLTTLGDTDAKIISQLHNNGQLITANAAPTINAATKVTGEVTEIADGDAGENSNTLTDTGSFTISDANLTNVQTLTVVAGGNGYRGTFTPTINNNTTGDGTGQVDWTFSVADADVDDLAAGETLTQTYTVTVDDGNGGTVNQNITVTINGSNDAPTVTTNQVDATITEGSAGAESEVLGNPGSGSFKVTDVDLSDKLTMTVTPDANNYRGTFSPVLNDDGQVNWTFTAGNIEDLVTGQTLTQKYTVTIADGNGGSVDQAVTISLVGSDDRPIISEVTDFNYTANGEPSVIDSDLSLTDVDSPTLQSATVQITSNFNNSEDVLSFTDQNGITGSWDASTGTLTLTGSASVADYEAALESVSYQNTATSRDTSARTVTFTVNDGSASSAAATANINVSQYNQAPLIDQQNSALSMGGTTSDYLMANPVSGFPSNAFTVESWFKTTGSGDGLISYAVPGQDNEILMVGQENLSLFIGTEKVHTGISIADGQWHHVAWSWDSATGKTTLFIDGEEKFTGTLAQGQTIEDGGSLVIGQEQNSVGGGFGNEQAYDGEVRDIRVWNKSRTQAEVDAQKDSTLNGSESNLVSNYTIKAGESTVTDTGPAKNDLQRVGGTFTNTTIETSAGKTVSIDNITLFDPETSSETVEVTLSIPDGVLRLASSNGIVVTAGANHSGAMTLQGTLADITSAINGLQYQPANNFAGTATLTISVSDLGNASGADARVSTITRDIVVNEVVPETPEIKNVILNSDQQPVISGSGKPNSTLNFTINGNKYTATVDNEGNFSFTPPLTVNNGESLNVSLTLTDADNKESEAATFVTSFNSGNGEDSTLSGGSNNDLIKGGSGSNHISGGDGDDIIDGNGLHVGGRYDELLSNGSFENNEVVESFVNFNQVTLDNWTAVNTASITSYDKKADLTQLPQVSVDYLQNNFLKTKTDTSPKVELDANNNVDAIVQTFTTVNNALYTINLEVAPRDLSSSNFEIWWGGVHVKTVSLDQAGWQNIKVMVTGDGSEQSLMLRELPSQNSSAGAVINSASVTGLLPDGSSGELLTNGNFSADTNTAPSWRAVATDGITNADYQGGINVNTLPDGDLKMLTHDAAGLPSSNDSSPQVELDGNAADVDAIYQQVKTVAGETYTLSFDAFARRADSSDVEVWWGDQYVKTITVGTDWDTYTVNLPGDGTSQTLMLREVPNQSDNSGTVLSNVSLQGVVPESDTLEGGAGNDRITGSRGDDVITGGADNDVITSGSGRDRLVWQAGDEGTIYAPAIDRVTDFALGSSGDILDLQSLLDGEETTALDQFIHFRKEGADTVIEISPNANGNVTQNIVLENVDLTTLGNNDAEIISQLQSNGQLITSYAFTINTPVMGDNQINASEDSAVEVTGAGEPGASVEVQIRESGVPDAQGSWSLNGHLNGDAPVTVYGHTINYVDGPAQGSQSPSRQAIRLDGTNDSIAGNINVSETNYGVSFWFKTSSTTGGLFRIQAGKNVEDRNVYLEDGVIKTYLSHDTNGPETLSSANTYNDGKWHHVVHTFGGSEGGQKLYVDGVEVASGNLNESTFNTENGFQLGYANVAGIDHLSGDFAGLEIFNQALSQADVSKLYNTVVETTSVNSNGTWSLADSTLDATALNDGQLSVTATQTGNDNNSVSTTATVTLDTVLPTLTALEVIANTKELELTFSNAMDTDSIPELADFKVTVDGNAVDVLNIAYLNDTTMRLSLSTPAASGANVKLSYSQGNKPLQAKGANNALAETNNLAVTVAADTKAPERQEMTVNGNQITIEFNEDLDTSSLPDASAFTISLEGGGSRTVTNVSISDDKLTLTLDSPVTDPDIVRLDYNASNASNNGGGIVQDSQGNAISNFDNGLVANNTDSTTPTLNRITANGDTITLNYSEDLKSTTGLYGIDLGSGKNSQGSGLEMHNGSEAHGKIDGLVTGGSMTIATWARLDSLNNHWARIIDFGDGRAQHNIIISQDRTTPNLVVNFFDSDNNPNQYRIDNFFKAGEWVHITATVDNTGLVTVYKNGVEAASFQGSGAPAEKVRANNYVGKSNWEVDDGLDGTIDDLLIVNRDLNATEVTNLYNAADLSTFTASLSGDTFHAYDFENSAGNHVNDLNGNKPITLMGESSFDVKVGGVDRAVETTQINGNEVTLQLASPVADGETVTVGYNPSLPMRFQSTPVQGSASMSVDDDTLTISNNTSTTSIVLIDTPEGFTQSGKINLDFTITPKGVGGGMLVFDYVDANNYKVIGSIDSSTTITWFVRTIKNGANSSETVSNTSSDPSNLGVPRHVKVTLENNKATLYSDGAEKVSLQFSEDITDGKFGVVAGDQEYIYKINDITRLEDSNGIDAPRFDHGDIPVANVTDTVSPALTTAKINGDQLTLTLSEPLNPQATIDPTAFNIAVEGETRAVSGVNINGNQVVLTLSAPVTDGQQVTASYSAPAADSATNNDRLEDSTGSDASALSNVAVTNLTNNSSVPEVVRLFSDNANQWYKEGDTITVKVQFSERVNVVGQPQLQLETGTVDSLATYSSGAGTDTLSFTFTVAGKLEAADLNALSTSALGLNGGAITDLLGNNASLQLPAPDSANALAQNSDIRIDSVTPSVGVTQGDLLEEGNILMLKGGGFSALLSPGEAADTDLSARLDWSKLGWRIVDNSGSNTDISFTAADIKSAVVADDQSLYIRFTPEKMAAMQATAGFGDAGGQDLVRITSNGFFKDAAGNSTNDANTAGVNIFVLPTDAIAPTISKISSLTFDGQYGPGSVIQILLTFDEPVQVDGAPIMLLGTGDKTAAASFSSGSGTRKLVFQYTVEAGHQSTDLDVLSQHALKLNGGSITDLSGNPAILVVPTGNDSESLASQADLTILAEVPEVAITSVALAPDSDNQVLTLNGSGFAALLSASETEGQNLTDVSRFDWSQLTLKLKQPDGSFDNVSLTADDISAVRLHDDRMEIVLDNGARKLVDNDGFGTSSDDVSLSLSAGFISSDIASRASINAQTDVAVAVTTSGAAIVAVTADSTDGTYKVGDEVLIRVRFSEKVTLENYDADNDPLLLLLNDRAPDGSDTVGGHAVYESGSGSRELVFRHTVAAGDNIDSLNYRDVNALVFESQVTGVKGAATAVTINNASFEADALTDGQWITATPSGWTHTGGGGLVIWNPGGSGTVPFNDGVKHGNNVVNLKSGELKQTLSETFSTDQFYRLNVDIGNRKEMAGFGNYEVRIMAGNEVIGQSAAVNPAEGQFETLTLEVNGRNFATDFAGNGKPISIVIAHLSGEQINVDNVKFETITMGSIANGAENIADLSLPATNSENALATNSNIVVDNEAPQTIVSAVAYDEVNNQLILNGTDFNQLLSSGESLTTDITARLDWSKLAIDINNDGDATQNVTFSAGDVALTRLTDANTLSIQLTPEKAAELEGTFGYQGAGDGIDIQSGFLLDGAGNAASITLDGLTIDYADTAAPAVLQVRPQTSGSYATGDQVAIVVQLSEAVNITGVDPNNNLTKPSLTLDNGATAYYASGAGTDTLTFVYTVGSGSSEASGALNYSATNALTIPAGTTISDKAGLALNTTLPAVDSTDALAQNGTTMIDITTPDIVQVGSLTPNGHYNADKVMQIEVSFSEAVKVNGTPTLAMNTGGQAVYVSGSGSDKLIFNYTIGDSENTTALDVSTVNLTNGSITDLAGNGLNAASLPTGADSNSLASQTDIVVDTVPPNFNISNFFFWVDTFEFDVDQPLPGGPGASLEDHFKVDPSKITFTGTDDFGNPTTFTFNENELFLRVNHAVGTRGQMVLTTEGHERFKNWEGFSYFKNAASSGYFASVSGYKR